MTCRIHRPVVLGSAFLLVLLACANAQASPSFPGELESQLDMPCAPACTVCHRDARGGVGTAVQPFAQSMILGGLVLKKPESIAPALQAVRTNLIDSDNDGATDVDELARGDNPNQEGEGVLCVTYGCAGNVAARAPAEGVAWLCSLVLAVLLGSRVGMSRRKGSRTT